MKLLKLEILFSSFLIVYFYLMSILININIKLKNMKILFLLAPSEGKNSGGDYLKESCTFGFIKPLNIAKNVTQKDLKCSGERFLEGEKLNTDIEKGPFLEAINRYSGVVFNAIDYSGMTSLGKQFFENNILITSGMYGIIKPLDKIGNYKLPIETKGLLDFWGDKIVDEVIKINPNYIVNLLPISYSKLLGLAKCRKHLYKKDRLLNHGIKIININFLTEKDGKIVKLTHGVKKYRGEFIKNICEKNITNYKSFGGKIIEDGNIIDINIVIK